MIYGTYLSANGMAQAQHTQATIANNLANVETVGFKRAMTLHGERPLSDKSEVPDALSAMTGGTLTMPTAFDMGQGAPDSTGRPLDIALMGDGWLQVRSGDDNLLTRDGRLTLTANGDLALVGDESVQILDVDGQPVNVDGIPASSLTVDDAGTLRNSVTSEEIAQLAIVKPTGDASTLRPIGGNLYATDAALDPARDTTKVMAGYLEGSNVDPTLELTRLIEASRLLESNAQMIRHQDTAFGKLIEATSLS